VLIRLIIIGICVFFGFRMVRALFFSHLPSSSAGFRDGVRGRVNDMAQDPQCGIYVDTKQAISARVENEVIYFCSEECRKKYFQGKGIPTGRREGDSLNFYCNK